MLLWFVPQLMPLFLADGFRNPFGFIASGFCCVNPIALINEIFFFYIVTRPYVSWWTRKEVCIGNGGRDDRATDAMTGWKGRPVSSNS